MRSHDVRTEDGRVFRRNRRHYRSSKEPMCASTNPVPDGLLEAAPTNLAPLANPMLRKSSISQEVQLPIGATESLAQDKVNSSAVPKEIPVPSKPVKSTNLPVTHSTWSCLETTKLPKGLCCIEVSVLELNSAIWLRIEMLTEELYIEDIRFYSDYFACYFAC